MSSTNVVRVDASKRGSVVGCGTMVVTAPDQQAERLNDHREGS